MLPFMVEMILNSHIFQSVNLNSDKFKPVLDVGIFTDRGTFISFIKSIYFKQITFIEGEVAAENTSFFPVKNIPDNTAACIETFFDIIRFAKQSIHYKR